MVGTHMFPLDVIREQATLDSNATNTRTRETQVHSLEKIRSDYEFDVMGINVSWDSEPSPSDPDWAPTPVIDAPEEFISLALP